MATKSKATTWRSSLARTRKSSFGLRWTPMAWETRKRASRRAGRDCSNPGCGCGGHAFVYLDVFQLCWPLRLATIFTLANVPRGRQDFRAQREGARKRHLFDARGGGMGSNGAGRILVVKGEWSKERAAPKQSWSTGLNWMPQPPIRGRRQAGAKEKEGGCRSG